MESKPDLPTLSQQLSQFFPETDFDLEPLEGGASSRRFVKIRFRGRQYFPSNTILLMLVPLDEPQVLQDYMNIYYYLKRRRVPVPRLFEIHEPRGWVFLELKNLPTVETFLSDNSQNKATVLTAMTKFLINLQKKCVPESHCPAFRRKFDDQKYRYELNFHFRKQLLQQYCRKDIPQHVFDTFADELCRGLSLDVPVFVHRDFQSSNLFIRKRKDGWRFYVIDFQDARCGTPVYDLVSMLWDSYITVPEQLRERLLKMYYQQLSETGIPIDWEKYRHLINYTVIQRKLHDAGAFALNYHRFGRTYYIRFIARAVGMACEAMEGYPQFEEIRAILEKLEI